MQDCDQPTHDHRVAFALEIEPCVRARPLDPGQQPDLACAALNLGGGHSERLVQGWHFSPQLDDMAIAVFPIVKELEGFGDVFEGGRSHGRFLRSDTTDLWFARAGVQSVRHIFSTAREWATQGRTTTEPA